MTLQQRIFCARMHGKKAFHWFAMRGAVGIRARKNAGDMVRVSGLAFFNDFKVFDYIYRGMRSKKSDLLNTFFGKKYFL